MSAELRTARRPRRRLRPSVIATGPAMASTAAACYLVGGLVGLLMPLLAVPYETEPASMALGGGSMAAGVLVGLFGRRFGQRVFYGLNLGTVFFVGLGVWMHRGEFEATLAGCLYLVVSMYVFFFFDWTAGCVIEGLVIASILTSKLAFDAYPWGAVTTLIGLNLLIAGVTGWLVRAAAEADVDGLTGLPNRRGFDRTLHEALVDVERSGGPLTVAMIDLDGFAAVNEQRGRAEGDRWLQSFARDWLDHAGPDAAMARHGADEFAVIASGHTSGQLTKALDAFRTIQPDFSAGLASWQSGDTPSILAGRAELALYEAKSSGGGRTFSRDAGGEGWVLLSSALANNEFTVVYQPIVNATTGLVAGAEALLRWTRPGKGPVSPAEFIPIAESTGFITKLDHWVLETACREAAAWPRAVAAKVTVNVSGRELHQPDYYQQVVDVLIRTGLPANRLVLEVTESTMEADSQVALDVLRRLRADGVRIAIDDFGTGYSSLSRLHHLPADILKIDRSFVMTIQPQDTGAPLIAAITGLAHALGLTTVAEGVEHEYQARVLAHHGCDENQGWLHGRPDAPELIHAALAQQALSPGEPFVKTYVGNSAGKSSPSGHD
ncbi:putative bifunctional diguanylate cyclase/phosphodiesterase [Cryptosporangium phraense]|uniref:Bifunctional diguanylate cyclase/phosphodiesterase n=1 Tax=Cryptosporangium phraense TaxID=2593070 RepID=A0A545AXD8_9ACTN|nr:bifunctional diguanylate cyclase/phosphodiesterase [Cryptosporangium phraense]TQS45990.1 bifunctional diguanylate cyclase/phosphodiesterase [Cryptosporangium phraense]